MAELVKPGEQLESNPPLIKSDNFQGFFNNLANDRIKGYEYLADRIKTAIAKRDTALRVLNLT
jgi:hypothetical protein